jgi:glycosyltransferase involved in cell wall biosynthesis
MVALTAVPAMAAVSVRRVALLAVSFYPYSVPVYEELNQRIGRGFVVVALRDHPRENARVALKMGGFQRRLIGGRAFSLARYVDQGKETPFGLAWAPSLPMVLASLKPEVVISANFNLWTLTSIVMGYPTVISWEGTHHTERTVKSWRIRLRKYMAKRARAFVVNGALSRQYLIEALEVPASEILERGLCAERPPDWVQAPKKLLPGDPVRFLFVGRMIEGKGVAHLLSAAKLLEMHLGREAQFELVLVGDGPERERYQRLAGELGLQDRVRFTKFVNPDQVWKYYARAHVFVLPTLHDNWPLVVPEAMSAGLPVLVSKYAGSVPELIRQGENGYAFDPDDHEGLAACMGRYLSNPELIYKHGRRSLQLVSPYTPENVVQVIVRAIERARGAR